MVDAAVHSPAPAVAAEASIGNAALERAGRRCRGRPKSAQTTLDLVRCKHLDHRGHACEYANAWDEVIDIETSECYYGHVATTRWTYSPSTGFGRSRYPAGTIIPGLHVVDASGAGGIHARTLPLAPIAAMPADLPVSFLDRQVLGCHAGGFRGGARLMNEEFTSCAALSFTRRQPLGARSIHISEGEDLWFPQPGTRPKADPKVASHYRTLRGSAHG